MIVMTRLQKRHFNRAYPGVLAGHQKTGRRREKRKIRKRGHLGEQLERQKTPACENFY